ncbi:hypothetical protein IW261DRAFT_1424909 [Armillaria novae-zelandiae]|uniref:Uncharacterized protein n=1 Tax=Armillaria novae-zelandiae TaxID=153914 RepID=A0AA39UAK5_9AGAR|nr:hypothetical protein IW261DRAFT_1424909 [Armillaria novae-zelandiae]
MCDESTAWSFSSSGADRKYGGRGRMPKHKVRSFALDTGTSYEWTWKMGGTQRRRTVRQGAGAFPRFTISWAVGKGIAAEAEVETEPSEGFDERAGDREHGGQDPELQQRAYSVYQRSFALHTGTQRAMLGTYGRYIRQKDVGLVLSEEHRDLARGAVRAHTTVGARESTQAPREVCRRAVHAYTIAGVRESTLAHINGRDIFAGYPPSRRIRLNLCHLEANHRQYTVRVFEIEARSAPRNSERDIERKEGF